MISPLSSPRTYPTACKDCGDRVFFHTNGFGDGVIFDSLGPPWPVHACYEERRDQERRVEFLEYRGRMVALYGPPIDERAFARTPPKRAAKPTIEERRAASNTKGQPREEKIDIQRCDPEKFTRTPLDVFGYVRETHRGRKLSDKCATSSLIYEQLYKRVRATDFLQVTVIDTSLVSYTFLV